ncbi:di-heme oxidoredictase family protein [Tropicimonas sp. IMCC34011]|uniref:di-heme oxidoreductase family protein n=1 Tax=Tropicimonas sp. IMCC34011 TaxID=2248759 RepID=UPI00351A457A
MRLVAIGNFIVMAGLVSAGAFAAGADGQGDMYPEALSHTHLDALHRTPDERARIDQVTAPATSFDAPEPFEANQGGSATVRAREDADAFSQASGNISFERELDFKVGNGLFKKLWVSAPSSTLASDGLGPLFNDRSCQRCHLKDGRGRPPMGADRGAGMFLRISVPAADEAPMSEIEAFLLSVGPGGERTRPDPVYGGQIQDRALPGRKAEGRMGITYEELEIQLSGGEMATLLDPTYTLEDPGYGPPSEAAMLSPRVAPPMIGLGLLEAIPAEEILAHADPEDRDGDGISGRPQIVWSFLEERAMLGRFGLKAGAATIREQAASAFAGDIGISSPLFDTPAGDCTENQPDCLAGPHGGDDARGTEIDAEGMDLVTFYSQNLAVPERRDVDDPQVLRGKEAFYGAGCPSCHIPKHVTARLDGQPEQSFQLIWPYTDLLLHDMGEGLADDRPEGRATGREWRTSPLWGIGLTEQVNGHTRFLHDGRARSLLEAILWHGGEAQASRDRVAEMPKAERDDLIRFLESL